MDAIGVDNITYESDYPHSDSTWPTAPETLSANLAGMSDHDLDRVTHLNAMKHFNYDPFSVIPKEQATVGALRERAAGRDVSIRSTRKGPRSEHANRASDLGKLTKS